MSSDQINKTELDSEIKSLIIRLRRHKNDKKNWLSFRNLIENNIEEVCKTLNTRWLVSIADTYADLGGELERRNALYITIFADYEKLTATRLLMYDLILNSNKLDKLKKHNVVQLWDGMHSFNINRGDMLNNLLHRLRSLMIITPHLLRIFEEVISRMSIHDTTLGDLNIYHQRLLAGPRKRSLLIATIRKISRFFKFYRLP
jgi:hypothetical protein